MQYCGNNNLVIFKNIVTLLLLIFTLILQIIKKFLGKIFKTFHPNLASFKKDIYNWNISYIGQMNKLLLYKMTIAPSAGKCHKNIFIYSNRKNIQACSKSSSISVI